MTLCSFNGAPLQFDAAAFDKVNPIVGNKGTGKSHSAKLVLESLRGLGAPCWVYDINREFVGLPDADTIRVGENFQLSLHEVGFGFLMAVIDDMNPLQDVSRGALENVGPRLVREQFSRRGFATIEYLIDRAGQNGFHTNEKVNEAIETWLKMVKATHLFAAHAGTETLADRFARVVSSGGFLVFDLALLPPGRLRALTRGLNRRLDAICEAERAAGTNRYPFVFFEEAHFYTSPDEILNLITRGRHLGLTVFFITNTPGELSEVVFRQLDNLVCTGLGHSADLRTISRSALSDEETLQSLAVGLGQRDAMIVGRLTGGFPIVAQIGPLPAGYPSTGATRSFWDGPGHLPGDRRVGRRYHARYDGRRIHTKGPGRRGPSSWRDTSVSRRGSDERRPPSAAVACRCSAPCTTTRWPPTVSSRPQPEASVSTALRALRNRSASR